MPPLVDTIRTVMTSPRGGRPTCLVCGRAISAGDSRLRLHGGSLVHERCATYDSARRRRGNRPS